MNEETRELQYLSENIKFISEETVLAELCQLLHLSKERVGLLTAFCTQAMFNLVSKSIGQDTKKVFLARFRLSDVASGACDMEVLKTALEQGFEVYVNPTYHGKIYFGDKRAIIGSSNLTASGFGNKTRANVEQNCLATCDEKLEQRISLILERSIKVSSSLLLQMQSKVESLDFTEAKRAIFDDMQWSIDVLDQKLNDTNTTDGLDADMDISLSDCLWSSPLLPREAEGTLLDHDRKILRCPENFDINVHLDYVAFALERSKIVQWLKDTIEKERKFDRAGIQFGIVKESLKRIIDPTNELSNDLMKLLVSNLFAWIRHVQQSDEVTLEMTQPGRYSEVVQPKLEVN